jgi:hypothetical protein
MINSARSHTPLWFTWKAYFVLTFAFLILQAVFKPQAIPFRAGGPPLEPFFWVWILYTAMFLYVRKRRYPAS